MTVFELDDFLKSLGPDVLIAWDAPLTGPPDPERWTDKQDLTMRRIEAFFRQKGSYRPPEGISVLPYGGCPHWTISRRLLGLPRIGQYDSTSLPFSLATQDAPPARGRHVVEVHPAVALWRWSRAAGHEGAWTYKGTKAEAREVRAILCETLVDLVGSHETRLGDDDLDALVAWRLARDWINGEGVRLLGNRRTGSFLLPYDADLWADFDRYATSAASKEARRDRVSRTQEGSKNPS